MKLNKLEIQLFKGWSFGKINYVLFAIGLFLIITGYMIMASGEVNSFQSLTIAPVMLFTGYLVIIPLSLLWRNNKS